MGRPGSIETWGDNVNFGNRWALRWSGHEGEVCGTKNWALSDAEDIIALILS